MIFEKLVLPSSCAKLFYRTLEPSAALFWALSIVLAHILNQLTQPAGPASLKYGRGQFGSI